MSTAPRKCANVSARSWCAPFPVAPQGRENGTFLILHSKKRRSYSSSSEVRNAAFSLVYISFFAVPVRASRFDSADRQTAADQLIEILHAVFQRILIHQVAAVVMRESNSLFLTAGSQPPQKSQDSLPAGQRTSPGIRGSISSTALSPKCSSMTLRLEAVRALSFLRRHSPR